MLERLLAAVRDAGALSLLDVKRGDIGSTTAGYAGAYLDPASPLAADAMTASPYLGFGSLRPLLDAAYEHGRGVFVLALTSNPEGAAVQRAVAAGRADRRADDPGPGRGRQRGRGPAARVRGRGGRGDRGRARPHRLDHLRGPVLAPGLGAQGAGAGRPAGRCFGAALPWVLPAASREVLGAGPDPAGSAPPSTGWRTKCSDRVAASTGTGR